jgi:hypothetical protein
VLESWSGQVQAKSDAWSTKKGMTQVQWWTTGGTPSAV